MANLESSMALQSAVHLIRSGKRQEAVQLMRRTAEATEQKFGADSPRTASAYNDLGNILVNLDDAAGAVDAYRRACAGPEPTEDEEMRQRLTYSNNLGWALLQSGQLLAAEAVLMRNLEDRGAFFGTEHDEYGYGLESLASVLVGQGRFREALVPYSQAVETFWTNGNPRVAAALASRAVVLEKAGHAEPRFPELNRLPDEILERILSAVTARREQEAPGLLSKVLQGLLERLRGRPESEVKLIPDTLTWISNLETMRGETGDLEVRIRAAREVIELRDRQGKSLEALHAVANLAMALSHAGRNEEALAAYCEAVERADLEADLKLRSRTRRNLGLLLAELKRLPEAETELQGALEDAEAAADEGLTAQARLALGIFLQHQGRPELAGPLLKSAFEALDPGSRDGVTARLHWKALESGTPCRCDQPEEAMAESFRQFVLERLPADLVQRLEVHLENGEFHPTLELSRSATETEIEQLQQTLATAFEEFRRRLLEIR